MTGKTLILGHVEACANGFLTLSDCSAVWELSIIGVALVAAVWHLAALELRSFMNARKVSSSGQGQSLRDPHAGHANKDSKVFGYWKCNTPSGTLYIRLRNGSWHALLQNESLGIYRTPKDALDGLVQDSRATLRGIIPSELNLPSTLGEWEFVRK